MNGNSRLHNWIVISVGLCAALLLPFESRGESEAYSRQLKFETERAKDFRVSKKSAEEFDRQRMSGVPKLKAERAESEKKFEQARQEYIVQKRREDAKKLSDEYVERMLAQDQAKEEKIKETYRKEFKSVQLEIERAIKNSRLNEAEEYQLD